MHRAKWDDDRKRRWFKSFWGKGLPDVFTNALPPVCPNRFNKDPEILNIIAAAEDLAEWGSWPDGRPRAKQPARLTRAVLLYRRFLAASAVRKRDN